MSITQKFPSYEPGGGMMRCPVCGEYELVMTERQGIEIDYCPHCRGVWLDRGELDKIIERAATMTQPRAGDTGGYYEERPRREEHHDDYDYHRKKKRRGFLDDIFDFD